VEIRDEPYMGSDARRDLEQLNDIAAQFLPDVLKILAETVDGKSVHNQALVAECVNLLRKVIRAQKKS
jgi:hypothetical protein